MKTYSIETAATGPMLQRTVPLPTHTTIKMTPANSPTTPFSWHGEADSSLSRLCTDVLAELRLHRRAPLLRQLPHRLLASLSYATKIRVETVCENLFHQNKVEIQNNKGFSGITSQ